jgi:hypothetical protein
MAHGESAETKSKAEKLKMAKAAISESENINGENLGGNNASIKRRKYGVMAKSGEKYGVSGVGSHQ